MNSRQLIAGASLVLFLAGMANVVASPAHEVDADRIKVSFADLNINREEGARVLYRRLQTAAEDACGVDSLYVLGSVERVAATRECYRETMDELVAQIDSAALKKVHAG